MYIAYTFYLIALISPLIDLFVYDKKGEKNLLVLFFTLTPLLMIDKKGEKYLRCICMFPCFIIKGGEVFMFMHICFILKKNLMSFMLDWHVYLRIFAYIFMCFHCIFIIIVMHELRGSFFEALL